MSLPSTVCKGSPVVVQHSTPAGHGPAEGWHLPWALRRAEPLGTWTRGCFASSLIGVCVALLLIGLGCRWLVGWLVGWLVWLVDWLVGWLVGCLVGWLFGWLVVCLFGWFVWLVG